MRLKRLWQRLWADPGDYVSQATVVHHLRHELTRGVDLPYWNKPDQVRRMRRAEARQMRLRDRSAA